MRGLVSSCDAVGIKIVRFGESFILLPSPVSFFLNPHFDDSDTVYTTFSRKSFHAHECYIDKRYVSAQYYLAAHMKRGSRSCTRIVLFMYVITHHTAR